jgi:hypothetical protein
MLPLSSQRSGLPSSVVFLYYSYNFWITLFSISCAKSTFGNKVFFFRAEILIETVLRDTRLICALILESRTSASIRPEYLFSIVIVPISCRVRKVAAYAASNEVSLAILAESELSSIPPTTPAPINTAAQPAKTNIKLTRSNPTVYFFKLKHPLSKPNYH